MFKRPLQNFARHQKGETIHLLRRDLPDQVMEGDHVRVVQGCFYVPHFVDQKKKKAHPHNPSHRIDLVAGDFNGMVTCYEESEWSLMTSLIRLSAAHRNMPQDTL